MPNSKFQVLRESLGLNSGTKINMSNAEFKLICESLGFYSAEIIRDYFKTIGFNDTANIRPIQYWLNGKQTFNMPIPQDVVEHIQKLNEYKFHLASLDKFKYNTYLFKDKTVMWAEFPELNGLPCSYLNQLMLLVSALHGHRHMTYFVYDHN